MAVDKSFSRRNATCHLPDTTAPLHSAFIKLKLKKVINRYLAFRLTTDYKKRTVLKG